MKKNKLIILIFLLFLVFNIQAQEKTITGTVKSISDGQPLPGTAVVIKGTTKGTETDIDGKYSIKASPGDLLNFIFLGMKSKAVKVGSKNVINVQLEDASNNLDEIVVTAMGMKRERKELGYSFQDVKGKDLTKNPTISVAQSLYGKVSGVNISQTVGGAGASSRVIIRGNNSINGNNQPLYIVDGISIGNNGLGSVTGNKSTKWASGIDNGDGLSSLNMDDVENISVLKGGAATALYGERGANGVILITTKKGKKNTFKVGFNTTTTIDMINADFKDYQKDYGSGNNGILPNPSEILTSQAATTVAWGPKFDTQKNKKIRIFDGSFKPYKRVKDNIQSFFRPGFTLNNNVFISGGGDKTTYRFSYGNVFNEDVIPTSGLTRDSYSININSNLKNLNLTGKVTYISEKTKNRPSLADDPSNVGFSLAGLTPNFDQKWLKHYQNTNGKYYNWNFNQFRLNPYFVLAETKNNSTKNRILGNFRANLKLNDWINLRGSAGIDRFNFKNNDYINSGSTLPGRQGGFYSENQVTFQEFNLKSVIDFRKKIGDDFDLTFGVGVNHRKTERTTLGINSRGSIVRGINNLANFAVKNISPKVDQSILVKSLFSYLRTNFKNYLFVDFSARNDWNSTLATAVGFPNNNNYSFFYPSVNGSFIFTKALNIPSDVLNFGKFRASWAQTGSAPQEPYATTPFYDIKTGQLLGNSLGSVGSSVVPNANLKPEISRTYELGLDLSFLKNRLGIDFSYYRTRTNDQLIKLNSSLTSGYNGAWTNIGLVQNEGFEALIKANILKNEKGLNWNMIFNISKNNNKIINLTKDTKTQVISYARWAGAQIVAQVGKSSSEIFGRKLLRNINGQVIVDNSGLPKLTDNFESLGKAVPDWITGFTNNFSYRNFNLSMNFDMKIGGYVYSMTNAYAASSGLSNITVKGRDEYNAWVQKKIDAGLTDAQISSHTPEAGYVVPGVYEVKDARGRVMGYKKNKRPVNPQVYWNSLYGNNTTPEPFVYDASYAKLRGINIGYTFSPEVLSKLKLGLDNLSISIIGRNLWTIYTKIPNIDPESTYTSGNGQGFEYGSLPYRRSYGFNIKASF